MPLRSGAGSRPHEKASATPCPEAAEAYYLSLIRSRDHEASPRNRTGSSLRGRSRLRIPGAIPGLTLEILGQLGIARAVVGQDQPRIDEHPLVAKVLARLAGIERGRRQQVPRLQRVESRKSPLPIPSGHRYSFLEPTH